MAREFIRSLFIKHPIVTNIAVCVSLSGAADMTEQTIVKGNIDFYRTTRVASTGFFIGPMNHFWYRALDKIVPGAPTGKVVLKKIVLDFCCIPLFQMVYMTHVTWWEGKSFKEACQVYPSKFFDCLKLDIMFWPPVQAFNFFYLPLQYRVLYVNSCAFVYQNFLTYIKHDM